MEHESLEFKIVMEDGPDTEVLARVRDFDLAFSFFTVSIAKYPGRNIDLRQGARVIRRHEGESKR